MKKINNNIQTKKTTSTMAWFEEYDCLCSHCKGHCKQIFLGSRRLLLVLGVVQSTCSWPLNICLSYISPSVSLGMCRTNFIQLRLPTSKDPKHWLQIDFLINLANIQYGMKDKDSFSQIPNTLQTENIIEITFV